MNFWKRYPADYARKTARLTLAQHGAYTLLLDELYTVEQPLPGDLEELYRICRAMSKPEREAVEIVAERFFPIGEDGLRRNKRAGEELHAAAPAIQAARENGTKGGRPKKPRENPVGLQNGTGNEPSSKAPQSSELREEKDSEAIASAAAAAQVDRVEAVFTLGVPLLTSAGVSEKHARSFLGRLRKFNTDSVVLSAIDRCARANAVQPVEFLQGCLKTGLHHENKQEAFETGNRRAVATWLAQEAT